LQPELNSYEAQIDGVVCGFMDIWRNFESMLPAELARMEGFLSGMSPNTALPRDRDYELFFRVSSALAQRESLTMGELSSLLLVPLSKSTRTADWLVSHGFVERIPDISDRRIVRVALTEQGRVLHNAIEDNIRRRVQGMLTCLSPEERETLFQLIDKVVAFVNDEAEKGMLKY